MSDSKMVRFRTIKPEIRVLGIDDGDFVTHEKGFVNLIGVVFRGGYWLEGVMQTEIKVDGMDATEKIVTMIKGSPHCDQLRVIMLDGITFAGFNIVDITELFQKVKLPVIAIAREKPNLEKIRKALENLPEPENRWAAIEHAGKISKVRTRGAKGTVYMQTAGIFQGDAETIVRNTSIRSNVPEALRVAHIIASGFSKSKERFKREDSKGNSAFAW